MNRSIKSKLTKGILFLFPTAVLAQTTATQLNEESIWANPLFVTLCAFAALLLVVIYALGNVIIALSKSSNNGDTKFGGGKFLTISLLLLSLSSYAQEPGNDIPYSIGGLDGFTFYSLIGILSIEVIIILVLLATIRSMLPKIAEDTEISASKPLVEAPSLMDKINASVSIEKEKDIMLDHNYDGIRELDNNLPPWWIYGFYITVIWGFIYLIYFHVSKTGDLQDAEYKKEVSIANQQLEEFRKKSANMVDESNVKFLNDEASLIKGKDLFISNCAACHGNLGEGKVGPNLTDKNWIHGGSIKDIFKSLKYGWPDKGMKAWAEDFSPSQLAMIASYVKSLAGTNPAGAKAPEGEIYEEKIETSDSTHVPVDSTMANTATADTNKVSH